MLPGRLVFPIEFHQLRTQEPGIYTTLVHISVSSVDIDRKAERFEFATKAEREWVRRFAVGIKSAGWVGVPAVLSRTGLAVPLNCLSCLCMDTQPTATAPPPMPETRLGIVLRLVFFIGFVLAGAVLLQGVLGTVFGAVVGATIGIFATGLFANLLVMRIFDRRPLSDIGMGSGTGYRSQFRSRDSGGSRGGSAPA